MVFFSEPKPSQALASMWFPQAQQDFNLWDKNYFIYSLERTAVKHQYQQQWLKQEKEQWFPAEGESIQIKEEVFMV